MSPRSGSIVAADAHGSVYRGESSGAWHRVLRLRSPSAEPEVAANDPEETVDESPEEPAPTVHALVFDPRNNGRVFLAGSGGLWRSDDEGETWHHLPRVGPMGEQEAEVFCLAPSSGNEETLLAGTSDGLFVSPDDGATWSRAPVIGERAVGVIAVAPFQTTVAVGTEAGVFISSGAGLELRALGGQRTLALALNADGTRLYEGTAAGLWVRSRSGKPGLIGHDVLPGMIVAIVSPRSDAASLYVLTTVGLYRSQDGGQHFVAAFESPLPDPVTIAEWPGKPGQLLAATAEGVEGLGNDPAESPAFVASPILDRSFCAEGVTALGKDARWAALLPGISLSYRDQHFPGKPHPVYQTAANGISRIVPGRRLIPLQGDALVVSASWSFDQLKVGARLSRALAELSRFRRERHRQLTRISRLAGERRGLESRMAAGIDDPIERTFAQLRLEEIAALLDASQVEISPR